MRAKHTPGPWEFDGNCVWADAIQGYVADPQTEDILSGEYVPLSEAQEQWEANARLIAAAPELLEALREALREIIAINNEDQGTFRKRGGTRRGLSIIATARAAIAKATGETK
jgi:hypothetical protein